ncbi:hypothetical protein N0V88_006044 [Collariella sp. IMI 366227]|nr:hypothetical protein N0V88_006044 [Collariella sp. IMI 366227]
MPHTFCNTLEEMDIGALFAKQVSLRPTKTAVVDGLARMNYLDLDRQAKLLAQQLRQFPFHSEAMVLLLAPPGLNNIICQVAIIYAGGTCVPLDPVATDDDLQIKVDFLDAHILITDPENASRKVKARYHIEYGHDRPLERSEESLMLDLPVSVASDYRSHILFTSGTSGIPKSVQVSSRALLQVRQKNVYSSEDRFGHANSTCFDGSLFDIWVPLIIGATIIVIRRDVVLDPPHFTQLLADEGITVIMLTASLLTTVVTSFPDAFRKCRVVLTIGETPNIFAVRTILENGPPARLVNAYGPTETGIFVMTHDITPEDALRGDFPLGKAIDGANVILADDSLNVIYGQGTGEILIRGSSLSRGYYLNPSKTSELFLNLPGTNEDRSPACFYRTADIGERDESGQLFWRGRKNNEIKHHGYRISLDVIESELCKSKHITLAAVFHLDYTTSNSSWIIACVVPTQQSPDFRERCQQDAKSKFPAYMVPQIVCLDHLPVNANGKIDRKALATQVLAHREAEAKTAPNDTSLSKTEEELRRIWQGCLGAFSLDDIGPHSDFGLLGASSLEVTAALSRVRHIFGVSIPAQKLYENATLRGVAREIDRLLARNTSTKVYPDVDVDVGGSTDAGGRDLRSCLLFDTHLADDLEIPQHAVSDWTLGDEGKVFITGVTGFVGAFLPAVKAIRCLVRASTRERGRQRILGSLSKYQLLAGMSADHLAKIAPSKLGLDDASFTDLAAWASVIFHLAAHVDYVQPYSVHRPANVLGTLHVLQLATTARLKPVHYASTSAAFGPTGLCRTKWVSENEDIQPYIDLMPFETGYGTSKWVVEVMMRAAMAKGVPTTVHRLGFVMCDRTTGIGNSDDYVSRFSPANLNRTYHVLPDHENVEDMSLPRFREALQRVSGRCLKQLPYSEWVARLIEANDKQPMRMGPLLPVMEEKIMVQMTRWEAYEGMARFRTDNVRDVWARAGLPADLADSGVTEGDIERYLDFLGLPVLKTDVCGRECLAN